MELFTFNNLLSSSDTGADWENIALLAFTDLITTDPRFK